MQQPKGFPLASDAETPASFASLLDQLANQINALPATERPALAETLAQMRGALETSQVESHLRLAQPLEISGIAVWDLDVQTGQAWRSLRLDQIFGYDQPLPEWTYALFLQHVLPEYRQEVDDLYQAARLDGQPWVITCQIRRADDELGWIWISGQPQFDPSGRVTRYTGLVQNITAFKESELALVESERVRVEASDRFRSLAEASFEGIFISQGGIILEANEQCAHMLGYELDEIIGQPVLNFIAPEERERVRQVLQSTQERIGEYHCLRKDGSILLVEAHGRTSERDGRLTRVTVMRDISAQKQIEDALRQSEAALRETLERLQMVMEAGQLGTWSAEVHTGEFTAGALAMRMHGFAPDEMASSIQEANRYMHPTDRPRCEAAFHQALACTGRYEVEYRVVHPSGETRWVYALGTLDPSGQRLQGIVLDITERKQAALALQESQMALLESKTALLEHQAALLEQETRLRSVLENSLDASYRRDLRTGRYDYLSPAIEQVLGYSPAEMEALTIDKVLEYIHPDDRQMVLDSLERSDQSSRLRLVYRIRHKDGQYHWVSDTVSTHPDAASQPIYRSGILRDITGQVQTEQALRDSEAALREKETHLRLAQAAGQIGSWEWNLDSGVITWSPETYTVLGEDPDLLPTFEHWLARVDPLDQAVVQQAIERCALHGSAEMEYRYHSSDPNQPPRWIYTRAAMLSQVSPPGDQLATPERVMLGIHLDITERRRAEQNARFLADMGDLLLSLTDPREIIERVPRWLGRYLDPDWCTFVEANSARSMLTLLPGYLPPEKSSIDIPLQGLDVPMARFAPEVMMALRMGRTVVVDDSQTDLRTADYYERTYGPTQLRSFICIPHLYEDQWVGALVLVAHAPRVWRADEVALADSVSNLTWLAISQARIYQNWRTAEERFRLALDGKPVTVFTQDAELRYTWAYNPNPLALPVEQVLGKTDEDLLGPQAAANLIALKRQVLETGRPLRREVHYPFGGQDFIYDMMLEPQFDAAGKVTGISGAAMDVTEQRRLEKENMEQVTQMEVQHRLLEYREKERQELARDLHDGPIQTLVSAIFNIQFVKEAFENPTLRVELDQIGLAVKAAVGELREMVNELRPPSLIRFGLAKAIQVNAQDFRERHPAISLELELYDDAERLSEQLCLTLYRIYQESLNNIIRHAHATRVIVRLIPAEGHVILEVRDDGRGFNPPSDWAGQTQNGHFGLAGMRERAEAVGGMLQIVSAPGQGSIIQVTIPL